MFYVLLSIIYEKIKRCNILLISYSIIFGVKVKLLCSNDFTHDNKINYLTLINFNITLNQSKSYSHQVALNYFRTNYFDPETNLLFLFLALAY